jgi:RNA polymerase sigma-B factor
MVVVDVITLRIHSRDDGVSMTTSTIGATKERDNEYAGLKPLFHKLANSSNPIHRQAVRSELVAGHLPLAEHIARRYRDRGQPADDLKQVAALALIHAIDRFDPARGTDFLAFAIPTINGELRRYFRDFTWSVRVPRRLKELHAAIKAATVTVEQRLGRAPRPSELAAELRIPVEEVYEGLQVDYAYRCDSLDVDGGTDSDAGGELQIGVPDRRLDAVERRESLSPALAKLSKRDAAIVRMRFFEDLTQSQIAKRIGVSQMQVSRLLAAALRAMRTELAPLPADEPGEASR